MMIKYIHRKMKSQKSGRNPTLVCWLALGGDIFLSNIESKVEKLIKDIIADLGYELYDIQYVKEGKDNYLRIFIDKDGIVDINDCEKVNNAINDILDSDGPINESYYLEVSSPGLERVLRKKEHFEKQIGNEIQVKLYKAIDGKKELLGILKSITDDTFTIQVDGKTIEIDLKDTSVVKTTFDFENID